MNRLIRPLFILLLALAALPAFAQMDVRYHRWEVVSVPTDIRAGETGIVELKATIEKGWHVYQLGRIDNGPQGTEIEIDDKGPLRLAGKIEAPPPVVKHDPNFDMEVGLYENELTLRVPVKVVEATSAGSLDAQITVISQACDATQCDRPREDKLAFKLTVAEGEARPQRVTAESNQGAGGVYDYGDQVNQAQRSGLGGFFWFGFLAGLLALLTPCVFPMIPVTVSFFTKQGEEAGKGGVIRAAVLYCIGIIVTFTLIGLIVTLAFGATGVQGIAANPWVNAALFILFVLLAASLFGVFELRLPAALTTKVGQASRTAGFAAPLLLGLTFSITSFTCTVPIVGTILASAAAGEGILYPVVGMVAFSTALAIPFFLLALFPGWLKKLPRSGQWMVTVKAFMGFLELLAALKFLSNVDLVFQLGWITRPVFFSIWAIILTICGLYLLGWLRLPHEGEAPIGWLRRLFAVGSVAAAIYCLAGIQGANLGSVEAFAPPADYGSGPKSKEDGAWMDDYEAALARAKAEGKPVFVDFTGYTCTNCRYMERNVFPLPEVRERFDRMVLVKLYTDALRPESLRKICEKNRELQLRLTKSSTLPVYVVVDANGEPKKVMAFDQDPKRFIAFLDAGINAVLEN